MKATALSTPNIAFVKYWGNRNQELRLPAADSLSMTLDSPIMEISIEQAEELTVSSYDADGNERQLKEKEIARFGKHLELVQRYLAILHTQDAIRTSVAFTIHSKIPPAIGLASSAALFSGVAKAYAELLKEQGLELSNEQVSILARLGSGSAARSIMGGFVALKAGRGEDIGSAKAIQIAPASHWPLHDIVICPSLQEKEHGSTEGHHLAHTSPHYSERLQYLPFRQRECIEAIRTRDFERLQRVAEEDARNLHLVAQTSTPSLQYLTNATHRIIFDITALRESERFPVLYTMDAGPTVHLVCTDDAVKTVKEFAHAQKDCTVFETKVGNGTRAAETITA